MKKKKVLIPIIALVLFIAWYAFRPERLFINHRVSEELPAIDGTAPQQPLESGQFHGVAHATKGTASIYRLGDNRLILRFTNFSTSNGPDVHIYMVAAPDSTNTQAVPRAGFIDLGSIKGNIGDQNYPLGQNFDLSKYRSVSVWCKRFHINFGAAPLTPTPTVTKK